MSAPASPSSRRLVPETLRALLEPRRAGPLLLLGVALVIGEVAYSRSVRAGFVASLMALETGLAAPCAWRLWVEAPGSSSDRVWGWIAYVGLGVALLLATGVGLAHLLHAELYLLTGRANLLICVALFVVCGFGVGRDIALESHVRRERARADALALEAERAQLLAIRAHLDPHFLFNTLNAIAEWCHEDSAIAERALVELSAMLRTLFDGVREPTWPIARELELVRALFELHRLRDPDRFAVEWDVPTPLPKLEVPPLILLPLAENAMKHGPEAGHAGQVRLRLEQTPTGVMVQLTNPGPFRGPRPGSSGLPTLRRRLVATYGSDGALEIGDDQGSTRVRLALPSLSTEVRPG